MAVEKTNYYEILEVQSIASADEIHKAYLTAKNAYSGDSLALYSLLSEEEAHRVLELIEEAYNILSDPTKRKKYNKVRGIANDDKIQYSPSRIKKEENDLDKTDENIQESRMNKLVAKKRYGLEFELSEDFEKEIEQCTEFSGEFLKRIREYKKVDIPRLADMTKISKTYIKYIEEEDIEKMPAIVYVRGFVYQYAKCLKLNPDLVASSFLQRLKTLKGE